MKALLVGDLAEANNYGAIATSEALLALLKKESNISITDVISYESMYNPTPVGGFSKKKNLNKKGLKFYIKKIVKEILPFYLSVWAQKKLSSDKPKDFVPYRWSQFENYVQRVLNGEIFQYERRLLDKCDAVIINGEGNVVNGTDKFGMYRCGARYIFFIAYLAKVHYKKNVFVINHTVDPQNDEAWEIIKNVYPQLDWVSVREKLSYESLKAKGIESNLHFHADALFSYKIRKEFENKGLEMLIDYSKPYICVGDSSGVWGQMSKVKWDVEQVFTELLTKLEGLSKQIVFVDGYSGEHAELNRVFKKTGVKVVSLRNCSYHDLGLILKNAQVFISGRWHASILALISNTPCILFGADSLKTKALLDLYSYPTSFFAIPTLPIFIDDIVAEVKRVIKNRDQIKYDLSTYTKRNIVSSEDMIKDLTNN